MPGKRLPSREKRRVDRLRDKARLASHLRKRTILAALSATAALRVIATASAAWSRAPLEIHHIDGDRRNDSLREQGAAVSTSSPRVRRDASARRSRTRCRRGLRERGKYASQRHSERRMFASRLVRKRLLGQPGCLKGRRSVEEAAVGGDLPLAQGIDERPVNERY